MLPLILALATDFEEQRDRLTRTVERIGGRVAHIVDIIRTQKSFDDGAMVRKVVEVRTCINDGIKVLSESLRSRGIRLRVDCRGAPKEIWIQENKLHQALVNLVKNSMEAIDELARSVPLDEPSIDIRCYRQNDYLVIDIIDNGIGITDTHSRLIFSAGYSTKDGRQRPGPAFGGKLRDRLRRQDPGVERRRRQGHDDAADVARLDAAMSRMPPGIDGVETIRGIREIERRSAGDRQHHQGCQVAGSDDRVTSVVVDVIPHIGVGYAESTDGIRCTKPLDGLRTRRRPGSRRGWQLRPFAVPQAEQNSKDTKKTSRFLHGNAE